MAKRPTHVQSLSFDRRHFGRTDAKKWAKDHGFIHNKVHVQLTTIKLRQYSPRYFVPSSFRTKKLSEGVSATIAKLKPGYEMR